MNSRERTIRTETATITLVADRFIEQRISPTARLTTAAMEKCRRARRSVSGGIPCVVLIVVPDTVPVESEAANVDHYRKDSVDRSIIAMAVVVSNSSTSALNKFYFRYYPQAFQVRVLDSEDDARNWLNERLREDQTERTG